MRAEVAGLGLEVAGVAREGRPVVVGLRHVGVQGFREALWPGGVDRRVAVGQRGREAGGDEDRQRREEQAEHDELDLARLDLLAQVLRRAADHQPADEDRQQDVEQHRVQAGADAAEDALAVGQVDHRDQAADAGQRLKGGVDRAGRGRGRDRGPQRRPGGAEADLLALEVGADDTGGVLRGRDVGLGQVDDRDRDREEHEHRAEDRPALPAVADHAAVGERQRGRDGQHRQHLDEVRQPVRVLERERRVDVEEAAAVGAEFLDDLL